MEVIDKEPDVFERVAGILPEEQREKFLMHVAHVRTLHPNDDLMLLIEACGYFTLLAGVLPERIAHAVWRFEKLNTAFAETAAGISHRHQRGVDMLDAAFQKHVDVLAARTAEIEEQRKELTTTAAQLAATVKSAEATANATRLVVEKVRVIEFHKVIIAIVVAGGIFLLAGILIGHAFWK